MPDMFSPCFELDKAKDKPFHHLPLRSNPYMTPDTSVCRGEWARLLEDIKAARTTADAVHETTRRRLDATKEEEEAAFDEVYKMMCLKSWAENELAVVNAYCDWVDISHTFSNADYLAAIYDVKAFHRRHRIKHWKSLVP